jgi:hypothetical protein
MIHGRSVLSLTAMDGYRDMTGQGFANSLHCSCFMDSQEEVSHQQTQFWTLNITIPSVKTDVQ